MATSKKGRAFAGFFAGLFLLTSSALTIAVIVSMVEQGKDNKPASTTTPTTTPKKTGIVGQSLTKFKPTKTRQAELKYVDTKVGTGETVKTGATITADYVGALMSNGKIFDASIDHGGPQTFSLSEVIAGWSQAIPGMKVGGTRRLLIPANLAYGKQTKAGIPADSDLVFDVTIRKIDKQ